VQQDIQQFVDQIDVLAIRRRHDPTLTMYDFLESVLGHRQGIFVVDRPG
jgi:hypothetical protein